jgi:hypothetical protein
MKIKQHEPSTHERWANLRFSVVGHLLASPPAHGELQAELERHALAAWRHPVTSTPTHFGVSTIGRWYSAEPIVMRSVGPRRLDRPAVCGSSRSA